MPITGSHSTAASPAADSEISDVSAAAPNL